MRAIASACRFAVEGWQQQKRDPVTTEGGKAVACGQTVDSERFEQAGIETASGRDIGNTEA